MQQQRCFTDTSSSSHGFSRRDRRSSSSSISCIRNTLRTYGWSTPGRSRGSQSAGYRTSHCTPCHFNWLPGICARWQDCRKTGPGRAHPHHSHTGYSHTACSGSSSPWCQCIQEGGLIAGADGCFCGQHGAKAGAAGAAAGAHAVGGGAAGWVFKEGQGERRKHPLLHHPYSFTHLRCWSTSCSSTHFLRPSSINSSRRGIYRKHEQDSVRFSFCPAVAIWQSFIWPPGGFACPSIHCRGPHQLPCPARLCHCHSCVCCCRLPHCARTP